jgi:hypothetical protein
MDRWAVGVPIFLALFYLIVGWCVTVTNPELLVVDVDLHVHQEWGRSRQYAGTFWVVLRRTMTWPRWWR